MADLTNIVLSKDATDTIKRFENTERFEDGISVARFALAYALKNYEEFDPETFEVPDSNGLHYNIGTVDPDGTLSSLIKIIYPDTTTPYTYIRKLMVYGLMKLEERIDREGLQSISDLCR